MLAFVKDFLSDADIDGGVVRVAVYMYASFNSVEFHLKDYKKKSDLLRRIDQLRYNKHVGWHTATACALRDFAGKIFKPWAGDRPDAENVGIIVTDGMNNHCGQPLRQAEKGRPDLII